MYKRQVLKVVLNVSPVSVAGIFRRQESELCLCSSAFLWGRVFIAERTAFLSFSEYWVIMVISMFFVVVGVLL